MYVSLRGEKGTLCAKFSESNILRVGEFGRGRGLEAFTGVGRWAKWPNDPGLRSRKKKGTSDQRQENQGVE